jgi:CRP/FNR family transcriptional regulator
MMQIHPTPFAQASDVRRTQADVSSLLQLMDEDAAEATPTTECVPLTLHRVRAGTALFREDDAAPCLHVIRVGTFKTYQTTDDGHEQVLGFAGRSEVLGFDAFCTGTHPTGAIALEDSSVYAVTMEDVHSIAQSMHSLDRALRDAASRQLKYRGEIMELMAPVASEVRLARFLLQLSRRMVDSGLSARRMHLRMSRRDIAGYIGVAHETVSRSFSVLAEAGYVRVDNREVEICDMDGLKGYSASTRRPSNERNRWMNNASARTHRIGDNASATAP